jgi:hypothetical protein
MLHTHLRALRFFLRPLIFDDFAAPTIRNSSCFFPALIAAVNHFGFNPRPAQVWVRFSGLRYLGATAPLSPPRDFRAHCTTLRTGEVCELGSKCVSLIGHFRA